MEYIDIINKIVERSSGSKLSAESVKKRESCRPILPPKGKGSENPILSARKKDSKISAVRKRRLPMKALQSLRRNIRTKWNG